MAKRELDELLSGRLPIGETIDELRRKGVVVPPWGGERGLRREYDTRLHPINDRARFPDHVHPGGKTERVTRILLGWQKLAVRRMAELCFAIPVRRVYKPNSPAEERAAGVIEAIYQHNRIDSLNLERGRAYFASCEVATLWYAVEEQHGRYGVPSPIKVRCRTFSPKDGDELYPRFDADGDLVAFSIGRKGREGEKTIYRFDTYTRDRHLQWVETNGSWAQTIDEPIRLGKIPLAYAWRPEPIWEDTSNLVYECEEALSRNSNFLRRNSKPLFLLFADEEIQMGNERSEREEFRAVAQYPSNSRAEYVTWEHAIDNLKYMVQELRQAFFTQLQLPDFSFETMRSTPMSGEARKQLFIDAQLKVNDEKGRLLELFDRELNVLKRFARAILPPADHAAIERLQVETIITPYSLADEREQIERLLMANGNRPLVSQRESIEMLGWSDDVSETMRQIAQGEADVNLGLGF